MHGRTAAGLLPDPRSPHYAPVLAVALPRGGVRLVDRDPHQDSLTLNHTYSDQGGIQIITKIHSQGRIQECS